MHPGDRPVVFYARLYVHQHWMAAAMAVEDFLASQRVLDWPASDHRELADHHFVIEGIALAAKPAAVWRRDHANMAGRDFQNFRQRAMNVVWRLCRTPER